MLHSVVNNSCGCNPQRKVVALIFSAARLPRLLEEICWQFAAGLPAFSSLPFFRTQTPTCLQSWLHFRTPGRAPKKGPCPSFQDSVPIEEEFGAQIWGPDLAQIWAHLAMFFWLLVCARRACNSPNKYALPRGGRAGCGRDMCLMDQSNRSNIFSTVFRDVNLAAATVGTKRNCPAQPVLGMYPPKYNYLSIANRKASFPFFFGGSSHTEPSSGVPRAGFVETAASFKIDGPVAQLDEKVADYALRMMASNLQMAT